MRYKLGASPDMRKNPLIQDCRPKAYSAAGGGGHRRYILRFGVGRYVATGLQDKTFRGLYFDAADVEPDAGR